MNQKAIFLDRDGVINQERGEYTFRKEDFVIIPDTIDYLKIWQDKGYLLIVISNQGGIAKGLYTEKNLEELTGNMVAFYQSAGVCITDFFYCPHHPDYNGNCLCRKPDSLLIEKAIAKYSINPEKSFMIGDKLRDIQSAEKAGVKGILVEANASLKNIVSLIP